MDRFTRNFLLVALIGTAICAAIDKRRVEENEPKNPIVEAKAEATENYIFDETGTPLEKKSHYRLVSTDIPYIVDSYYLDDLSDRRIVIVRDDETLEILNVYVTD